MQHPPVEPGQRRTALVLGGARSGKTRRALALAAPFGRRVYVATAQAGDAEMLERIRRHQAERDAGWSTIEAPIELAAAIASGGSDQSGVGAPDHDGVLVVDCLTLWLSNLMFADRDIAAATADLIEATARAPTSVVFVSNEVGLGIVPDNALARRFRDAQGRLNQDLAAAVDAVEFVAAGLPLRLK